MGRKRGRCAEHSAVDFLYNNWMPIYFIVHHNGVAFSTLISFINTCTNFTTTILATCTSTVLSTFITTNITIFTPKLSLVEELSNRRVEPLASF